MGLVDLYLAATIVPNLFCMNILLTKYALKKNSVPKYINGKSYHTKWPFFISVENNTDGYDQLGKEGLVTIPSSGYHCGLIL